MRQQLVALAVVALTVSPLGAASQRPMIVSSQDHSSVEIEDCDRFHTRNVSSLPAKQQSQEQREIRLAGIDILRVRASESGGVSIRGWDRNTARVTICKSSVAADDAEAKRLLEQVFISYENGVLVADGPEAGDNAAWWVHMIIDVPRATNVDVEAMNGGIAVRNMSGRVNARATNGGISLAACAGSTDAVTQNGPISLKLQSAEQPNLEARAGDGEIICHLKRCGAWSADRKSLRMGVAPASIRLSTSRAPIVIENVR